MPVAPLSPPPSCRGWVPRVVQAADAFTQSAVVKCVCSDVGRAEVFFCLFVVVVGTGMGGGGGDRLSLICLCNAHLLATPRRLCTDNGVMVAFTGALRLASGVAASAPPDQVDISPRWPIGCAKPVYLSKRQRRERAEAPQGDAAVLMPL